VVTDAGRVIGQKHTPEDSEEIAAMPKLLKAPAIDRDRGRSRLPDRKRADHC
jgi:hypothetical protein